MLSTRPTEWDGFATDTFDGLGSTATIAAACPSRRRPAPGASGVARDATSSVHVQRARDVSGRLVRDRHAPRAVRTRRASRYLEHVHASIRGELRFGGDVHRHGPAATLADRRRRSARQHGGERRLQLPDGRQPSAATPVHADLRRSRAAALDRRDHRHRHDARASSSATSRATAAACRASTSRTRPATATPRPPTASSSSPATPNTRQRRRRRPRHRLRPRAVQPDRRSTARTATRRRGPGGEHRRLRHRLASPPTDVTLPFATPTFPERYEGMLVRFPQSLVISEYFNYDRSARSCSPCRSPARRGRSRGTAIDEPGAAGERPRPPRTACSRITLDDGLSAQNPPVLRHPNGDAVLARRTASAAATRSQNTVGVLGFDFSLYRIQPTGAGRLHRGQPAAGRAGDVGGTLRVAAMNTLNFFLTLDYRRPSDTGSTTSAAATPTSSAAAPTPTSRTSSRASATSCSQALAGLDADVIGLNELENTPGVDPLGDPTDGIVAGLNAMLGAGTYAYIDTGMIGTDAIRVGLIYKPAVVTPVGAFEILDLGRRPALHRHARAGRRSPRRSRRTRPARASRSPSTTSSRRAPPATTSATPTPATARATATGPATAAAQALVDWLATDPTGSGDPDFLIIGDLNSYAMEDPIDAIKAGSGRHGRHRRRLHEPDRAVPRHVRLLVRLRRPGRLPRPRARQRDARLGQVTGAAEWHINSDEPDVLDYDTIVQAAGAGGAVRAERVPLVRPRPGHRRPRPHDVVRRPRAADARIRRRPRCRGRAYRQAGRG